MPGFPALCRRAVAQLWMMESSVIVWLRHQQRGFLCRQISCMLIPLLQVKRKRERLFVLLVFLS